MTQANDGPSDENTPLVARLPAQVETRGGAIFDPRKDVWSYRDGVTHVSLNFTLLKGFSRPLVQAAKATFVWYAKNHAPASLVSRFGHLLRFAKVAPKGDCKLRVITDVSLINYKSSLGAKQHWYLGQLRPFFIKWHALGYAGVSDAAIRLLNQLRLPGNDKGIAVLTMDPTLGPYTTLELEAIQSALNAAYEQGAIETDGYVLAWLFMLHGQRPIQFAALKVCDVKGPDSDGSNGTYSILMPRAKQKLVDMRREFKERPVVEQIGEVLLEYARDVRGRFVDKLRDAAQAPLFPSPRVTKWTPGYEYHRTGDSIAELLKRSIKPLKACSERTGKPSNITPIRFRRTFGTRAAEEGYSPVVIAELLDHSDTQNVGVYTAATPAIIDRIDRAIALQMAPIAQAFAGVLIKDESEATRGSDPASRIVDLRIDQTAKPMGSCGQHGFCGFSAPIACYTCVNFEPWLDGPHEAVLAHLLSTRDRLLRAADKRIASANDRTILAVAEVIRRCSIQRGQLGALNG